MPLRSLFVAALGLLVVGALARAAIGAPRWIAGPAGRLAVDDGAPRGEAGAPPVLFVHSFAGSTTHWRSQLQHLRATRRALAIDLRGHGRSDAPADVDYAIPSLAADIAAAADALALRRFVLVGHSMGGAAAVAYAGAHPDRVAGLVLVGAPGKSPPQMAQQVLDSLRTDYDQAMADNWAALLKGARPAVRKGREAEMKRVPRDHARAMVEAIFAYDPLPALAAYPGPKLIVDTEPGDGSPLHEQAPQIERQVIRDSSHWPQLDDAKAFDRVLDDFLARVR